MKELYVKPEVEILLPMTEDIMTSSGEVPPAGDDTPKNPNAALPTDPTTPPAPDQGSDAGQDPAEVPGVDDADTGSIPSLS